jgi:hypothetical protein
MRDQPFSAFSDLDVVMGHHRAGPPCPPWADRRSVALIAVPSLLSVIVLNQDRGRPASSQVQIWKPRPIISLVADPADHDGVTDGVGDVLFEYSIEGLPRL